MSGQLINLLPVHTLLTVYTTKLRWMLTKYYHGNFLYFVERYDPTLHFAKT